LESSEITQSISSWVSAQTRPLSTSASETESDQLVLLIIGIEAASLFKAIQSLVDFEDVVFVRKVRMLESLFMLLDVDFTINDRLEKCCFDVEEVDKMSSSSGKSED